MPIVWFSQG
ncbi:hypothetical protein M0802_016689 [Mischocyttarus mexicanus]|nr:hypothetical protein M0802_016689 [Mischocyttarus mexicanus]